MKHHSDGEKTLNDMKIYLNFLLCNASVVAWGVPTPKKQNSPQDYNLIHWTMNNRREVVCIIMDSIKWIFYVITIAFITGTLSGPIRWNLNGFIHVINLNIDCSNGWHLSSDLYDKSKWAANSRKLICDQCSAIFNLHSLL